MCTRLVRNVFITNKITKCFVLNSNRNRRYPNKNILSNCKIENNKYESRVSTIIQIPKSHNNDFKFILGVSLLASMWYETNKEDVEENLAHLITLSRIALERGDIDRAEEILNLGLQISEQHKIYTAVPSIYDILAKIALGVGNIKKAQDICVTAIEKLTMWGFPEDDYNIIDFKLKLARIYSANGQSALAKIGFDSCLKQQREKISNGDTTEKTGIMYITILFWYGVHMIKQDNFVEARSMINTAYEYSTKIKGLSVKQEMIILYMLSNVHLELGDFESALTSMLNAIVLGKSISSIDLPMCYIKLGRIYEEMNNFPEAKFAYEEAHKSARMFGFFDIVIDAEDALEDLHKKIQGGGDNDDDKEKNKL